MNDVHLFLFLMSLPFGGLFLFGLARFCRACQDLYWEARDRAGVGAWMARRPR